MAGELESSSGSTSSEESDFFDDSDETDFSFHDLLAEITRKSPAFLSDEPITSNSSDGSYTPDPSEKSSETYYTAVMVDPTEEIEWCKCGNCQHPENEFDNFCCWENPEIAERMASYCRANKRQLKCITDHPVFKKVCLDHDVLLVARAIFRSHPEKGGAKYDSECDMRRCALRQFVFWCYRNREIVEQIAIPACVLECIHSRFPLSIKKCSPA